MTAEDEEGGRRERVDREIDYTIQEKNKTQKRMLHCLLSGSRIHTARKKNNC
jgi:hypothetical protein